MSTNPNAKLARIRYLLSADLTEHGYGQLIDTFRELDTHLTAGGQPPEAWREGPDAPSDTWGWQGTPDDPETGEARDKGPAPEGFSVFAHWSAVHDGVNVEMDVPDGLRVTVHYNDALMIDHRVSEDGTTANDYLTGRAYRADMPPLAIDDDAEVPA